MAKENFRVPFKLALTSACSLYILIGNPPVLSAGILGTLTVRDLAYLAWRRLLAAATGRQVEDRYYERLLNQGEWWQAAKSVLSTTRIMAILAQCSHPDVRDALLLGPSVTYFGALCVNAPLMFTGAVVTDLAARNATPHKKARNLSLLTTALPIACMVR